VKPIVAIVGRPNVGKSTLFNRLAGEKLAIVHDAPGVTRDRHYADAHLHGRELVLVDTGGFDPTTEDPMGQGIARQVELAIDEADVVLCVLDGSMPATEPDRESIHLLRKSGKPVVYAANKSDTPEAEHVAAGLYELGVARLIPISALHGRGMAELEEAIVEAFPPIAESGAATESSERPRIALAGRPNAGKSSLLNRLAGSERSLVDANPGTTRDPIDVEIEYEGRPFLLVDTAGIRRRARVESGVEAASVMRSIRAIERAEIVVLMCDASEGVTEQDARLLGLCAERGRGVVVGLNKVDLLDKAGRKKAVEDAEHALSFARWAPIVPLSVKQGFGVADLMAAVGTAADEFKKRISTGALNRFFEQVLERRPPPTSGGQAPRIYYITQAQSAPPVFVAVSNAPANLTASYRRFVVNQLRKEFGFEAVPIVVRYRKKRQRE
jgi:GTP-binding protein